MTFLLHEEPQSGLIIFGLFIRLAFEPGFSVSAPCTDVLTNVKIQRTCATSALIGFQAHILCAKNTHSDAAAFIIVYNLAQIGEK